MELTETIRRIRQTKGVSQAEIARRLNLERGNYSRLENRGNKLSLEQLESIANALDMSLFELLTWGEAGAQSQSSEDRSEEIQMLRGQIQELQKDLDRANKIVDAFVYMMNGGKGMNEARAQEVAKTLEADLDKAMEDAATRLELNTDKEE